MARVVPRQGTREPRRVRSPATNHSCKGERSSSSARTGIATSELPIPRPAPSLLPVLPPPRPARPRGSACVAPRDLAGSALRVPASAFPVSPQRGDPSGNAAGISRSSGRPAPGRTSRANRLTTRRSLHEHRDRESSARTPAQKPSRMVFSSTSAAPPEKPASASP